MIIMVHNPDPHIINLIGMGVGFLSLCIALYLQTIASGRCPLSYILAYTILGSSMVLIHVNPIVPEGALISWAKVLLYIGIIIILLWSGARAKTSMDLDGPIEEVEEGLGLKGD